MNFTGKVVMITGASSGIAAATAVKFARCGACLSLVDRNEKQLGCTIKQCMEHGTEPYGLHADLTEMPEIKCAAEKTIKRFGHLDILVNAAGIMPMGTIQETSVPLLECVLNTNLRSMYYLTQLMVPQLLKSKGCIVNVSSVCGLRAFPNLIAYNISKAAVDHFTRSLALDMGKKCVRVNAVNPGVIRTNLHLAGGMLKAEYKKFLKRSKKAHALGRIGEPDEVANAICFLASDLASFITGVCLPVDGGKQVMCPR